VIAQAVILFGALAYAILEAIRVIIEGSSDVAGASLIAYGLFSALVSLVDVADARAEGPRPALVEVEVVGWFSGVPANA
jgi:predicted Co/Zn/Cd cation transporter (cation efflux family)